MNFLKFFFIILYFLSSAEAQSFKNQPSQKIYKLSVDYKNINITGENTKAMAINDSIPAPTLYFKQGEKAVIYVTNKMDEPTSVHWHGILLPNYEDGVPYLTSPPIKPNKTHKFEFLINQSAGTYWYHSHTGLQEQRGLYGAIVIEPKQKKLHYDHNLVLVLSDWTDENPKEVMRTLKRGSEWYAIKKDSVISFFDVVKQKALGAQLTMWKQRMPGMDISDVYYPAFLINGKQKQNYPQFKAGEKIRVRVVNASASTYFWLSFGGKKARLVSADGVNIQTHKTNKLLQAIAETYDFIIKIPSNKSIEFKATAQDGSGFATALIGKGKLLKAVAIPKINLIESMKSMAKHHSGGGHSMMNMAKKQGGGHSMKGMAKKQGHSMMNMNKKQGGGHSMKGMAKHHSKTQNMDSAKGMAKHNLGSKSVSNFKDIKATNYDHLKSKTKFISKNLPVREIKMDLTGNMWRYVWSINKKVLSKSDKIKIHKGEIVRLVLNNTTMMHHPMHLHGHFFRVINRHGDYSPLKHTVDVPPMSQVAIEFEPSEVGDWFFHCHVLYHMKGGMSRVFKTGNQKRDIRLKNYSDKKVFKTDKQFFKWGEVSALTNHAELELTLSNTSNRLNFEGLFSWFDPSYKTYNTSELEGSYEYFLTDFFRLYGSAEVENPGEDLSYHSNIKLGVQYLLPYFIDLSILLKKEYSYPKTAVIPKDPPSDLSLQEDNNLELEIQLSYNLMLLKGLDLITYWEGSTNLNQLKDLSLANIETQWSVGLEYTINKQWAAISNYDNRFGLGAGLNFKF